jgi:hypothetical protein
MNMDTNKLNKEKIKKKKRWNNFIENKYVYISLKLKWGRGETSASDHLLKINM